MSAFNSALNIHDIFAAGAANRDTNALVMSMDERIEIVHRVGTGHNSLVGRSLDFKKQAPCIDHRDWCTQELYERKRRLERPWFTKNIANSPITEVWFNDFVVNGHYNEAALMILILAKSDHVNCHLDIKKVTTVFDAVINDVETTKDLGYRLAESFARLSSYRRILTKERLAKLPKSMRHESFHEQLRWASKIGLVLPEAKRSAWYKMVEDSIAEQTGLSDGTFTSIDEESFSYLLKPFAKDNQYYGNIGFGIGEIISLPTAQIGFNIFERFADIIQKDGSQEALAFYQKMVEMARQNPVVVKYFEPKAEHPAQKQRNKKAVRQPVAG